MNHRPRSGHVKQPKVAALRGYPGIELSNWMQPRRGRVGIGVDPDFAIQFSGVPLNAISPREAKAEAKAKQCDFILYTDLTALKTSVAKGVSGFLGRASGVGSGGVDKVEAKVEFQLFAVGETAPRLKSAATAKEEVDEASAATALDQEAKQVSAEVRKKRG